MLWVICYVLITSDLRNCSSTEKRPMMRDASGTQFLVRWKYSTIDINGRNIAFCSETEVYRTWPVPQHYGTKRVSPEGNEAEALG
jgi:hypothetical protein